MDQCWRHNLIALIVLKNTPLFRIFSRKILFLTQAGLVNKWKKEELDKVAHKLKFKARSVSASRSLQLPDFKGLFALWGLCYGISILVWLLEICIGYRKMIKKTVLHALRCVIEMVRIAARCDCFPCKKKLTK